MGFFIKKSFGGKHLRFNLSKSGIGTSFGVKGLRFGVDGKGRSYISGGKGMFRFREYLTKSEKGQQEYEYLQPTLGARIFGVILAALVMWLPDVMLCSAFGIPDEYWGTTYLIIIIYFMPLLINGILGKKSTCGFIFLNLFLNWTVIVWLISIISSIIWKIKEVRKQYNVENSSEQENI
jgi:hypothetical protein